MKTIARQLNVSAGSVHRWCKDIPLTDTQKNRLDGNGQPLQMAQLRRAAEAHSAKARSRAARSFDEGAHLVGALTDRDLLLLGIGLYWGEGSKRQVGSVSIANMDPCVHAQFLRWIGLLGARLDAVTARLTISEEANLLQEEHWWAERLKLPLTCFRRAITRISPTSQRKTRRPDYHGILALRYHDTPLWHRIMGMVSRAGFEPALPP